MVKRTLWLSGVRRVGKTTLARMLPDAMYMNSDCLRHAQPVIFHHETRRIQIRPGLHP